MKNNGGDCNWKINTSTMALNSKNALLQILGSAENWWGLAIDHTKPKDEELDVHDAPDGSSECFDFGVE